MLLKVIGNGTPFDRVQAFNSNCGRISRTVCEIKRDSLLVKKSRIFVNPPWGSPNQKFGELKRASSNINIS